MLLVHQIGSVKIGEVVRYTVTYTPSQDRILPSPDKLHMRVRNTSSIALRAAFVHGPYTLSVAAYPSNFDPNVKFANPHRYGIPEFEPLLKAGGSWECELVVPDTIRQAAGTGPHGGFGKSSNHDDESATWIIEVSSQVIFSTSAAVGYDIVVARDQKSLSLTQSLPAVGSQSQVPQPGKVTDLQQSLGAKDGHHAAQPKGVFSRAVHVTVEDTAALWNTPRLPTWDDAGRERIQPGADAPVESMVHIDEAAPDETHGLRRQKKLHLVILTHGIHSSLGADLLYMKESIDAAAKEAKIAARARRAKRKMHTSTNPTSSAVPISSNGNSFGGDGSVPSRQKGEGSDEEDEEEIIVRGFSGNATKTEKGIKYLGKRLARYVLSVTYPDQPLLPIGKGAGEGLLDAHKREEISHFVHQHHQDPNLKKAHRHSTIHADEDLSREERKRRPYKITSISFIGHSLGGLVQTYSVAYIQKHSPHFFDLIKPINFVALASPFLGLSNENPLYVRFALDFGLVGRTGQDLGLTWRAPTIARSGWGAIVGNLGESAHKRVYGETQPESKPLLRILPTGPAHTALRKFRNRTVYSNVVNDGIVPLRTSCLLFLDWQGLGRVDKARRDAGLVETVVGFGWAELTGTNMANNRQRPLLPSQQRENDSEASSAKEDMRQVPQPSNEALHEDDRASLRSAATPYEDAPSGAVGEPHTGGPLSGFFNLFRSNETPKAHALSQKQKFILRRGQTMPPDQSPAADSPSNSEPDAQQSRPAKATSGHELEADPSGMLAPPKTTFFESAGDLLNPSRPPVEFILDPAKRPRTIFHDRVYHPADIPPTPMRKRPSTFLRRKTFDKASGAVSPPSTTALMTPRHTDSTYTTNGQNDAGSTDPGKHSDEVVDNLRVEEKIARGYHRDLSWRKVLVKLEPDAHNNIIVRRMFANAFGWPVVKHLVDAHFSDLAIARVRDDDEPHGERALDMNQPPDAHGGETKAFASLSNGSSTPDGADARVPRTEGEAREALDQVPDLPASREGEFLPTPHAAPRPRPGDRADSVT